jgi:glycosyltransferase involved in cell wall biosynthesis
MSASKKKREALSQKRLRQIAWEVGHGYPIPLTSDYIALCTVHPHLGHLHWNILEESAEALRKHQGGGIRNAPLVVRVYDVTDVLFDGHNAHSFIDLHVNGLHGSYYFGIDRLARNYLAEIGFRSGDGSFYPLARSDSVLFDRDRPSGNYQVAGLFGGGYLGRVFPVENVFDAPVYERMNRELAGIEREEALRVAAVFIRMENGAGSPLGLFIKNLSQRLKGFGGNVRLYDPGIKAGGTLTREIKALSKKVLTQLGAAHRKKPFHLVHCHDWYSSAVGLSARKTLALPMVLSLHSTEHERTHGDRMSALSMEIRRWEKAAVQGADLVIVPHSSTRQQVISLYEAPPEKVVIIPDVFTERPPDVPSGPSEVKRWFGLNQDAPLVLFSGEISHASGADLLADALPTVCRNHATAQFVFAGDGPLRGELEARIGHAGIGHRCRFLGDVTRETFEALLMASDFVVIPARTWQDEGLAQTAIACGRPVLTTHQAGINCVVHGQNGLVTFDNPGSIVWGIQELLFNPLKGSMLQLVARKKAGEAPSLQSIAAQHYMQYEMALKGLKGAGSA